MAIVVNQSSLKKNSMGNKWEVSGTFAWTTYTTGGDAILAAKFGLSSIESMEVSSEGGYLLDPELTVTGVVVKAFQGAGSTPAGTVSAPVFTGAALGTHAHDNIQSTGEALTVTAGTGVSSAAAIIPIANVESVYVTAGGVTGVFQLVPGGVTPGTGEVGYDPTTGIFQFLIADAITAATVQYIGRAVTAVSGGTPAGTNSAPTFTGTAGTGSAGAQVSNGTNLAPIGDVEFIVIGL